MKTVLLLLVVLGGCGQKKIDFQPRVSVWNSNKACIDNNVENSERWSKKEPEFCRAGTGLILMMRGAI